MVGEASLKTFSCNYVYLNDLPDDATVNVRLPKWIEDYNYSHSYRGLKMKSSGSIGQNSLQMNEVVSGKVGATTSTRHPLPSTSRQSYATKVEGDN